MREWWGLITTLTCEGGACWRPGGTASSCASQWLGRSSPLLATQTPCTRTSSDSKIHCSPPLARFFLAVGLTDPQLENDTSTRTLAEPCGPPMLVLSIVRA